MPFVMSPWQQVNFPISLIQEWHSPFIAFVNIAHSLIVNEETKHNKLWALCV